VHTVTKVLVVFAAILCVVLSALTMAYAVNADRVTGDYNDQVALRLSAERTLTDTASQHQQEITAKQTELAAANAQIAQLMAENRRLAGEKTDLISRATRAEADAASVLSKIDQLAATNQTQAKVIESYSNEVTSLRDNELRYRREQIQLSDRIAELTSQNEVLAQNTRALQEQLTEAQENAQAAAAGVVGGAATKDSTPRVPSIKLEGRVTRVDKNASSGDTLAQINLGTNNQLRDNMRLYVTRNGQYLADIIIVKADQRESVGRIMTYGRAVEVRVDDTVTSTLK
jgi:uncharacterized phage infection (PIP) family protein YhgE